MKLLLFYVTAGLAFTAGFAVHVLDQKKSQVPNILVADDQRGPKMFSQPEPIFGILVYQNERGRRMGMFDTTSNAIVLKLTPDCKIIVQGKPQLEQQPETNFWRIVLQ